MSLPIIPLGLLSAGGTTDFATLRGTSHYIETTYQNSHDVTLPAGTTTGDKVVVFGWFSGTGFGSGVEVATPAGWNKIALLEPSAFADLCVFWADATGPMSDVTIAREGGADAFTARCNAYSFSAHSDFAPVVSSLPIQVSTATPDPPSLTVPAEWGSSPHVTWLSCVYRFDTNTTSAASANYSDIVTTGDGDTRVMSARRNRRIATEDPGPWTTSAAASAVPFTIAVRGIE